MRADLIARLEKLDGPDREVDEAIQAWSVGATIEWQDYAKRNAYHRDGSWVSIGVILPYTASLDAAVALAEQVLPGWYGSLRFNAGPAKAAIMMDETSDTDAGNKLVTTKSGVGEAATPAIALLIAILKALSSSDAKR